MAVKYWVGSNMPGYMPDSEPFGTESYAEALGALMADLELERESVDLEGDEDAGDDMAAIDGAMNKIESLLRSGKTQELHIYSRGRHFYLETY